MWAALVQLLPVVAGIAAGFTLRRTGSASRADGDFVFRLVFQVCLPPLMFSSLSQVEVTSGLAVFPLAALAAGVVGHVAARVVVARAGWPPERAAVALCACMVVNGGFALTFAQALYGADGVARIAAFEAVNATLAFTWVYRTAARGNPEHTGGGAVMWRALLRSLPMYGLVAGLVVNLAGIPVPRAIAGPVDFFGSATAFLIAVGVGLLFEPPRRELAGAALTVGVRVGTGFAVALVIVAVFGLGGADRTVLLLLAAAPLATVTVAFASMERLDTGLAVSALSLSMVSGFVLSLAITLVSA